MVYYNHGREVMSTSKKTKQKGLKPQEIAELIIKAIVAVAALITALKS
jgi:hypothetical protein